VRVLAKTSDGLYLQSLLMDQAARGLSKP